MHTQDAHETPFAASMINAPYNTKDTTRPMNENVSLGWNDLYTQGLELESGSTEKPVTVYSCNAYLSKIEDGFYARSTFTRTMESFFIKTCHPLLFLKYAKSSRNSHFNPPYFHENSLKDFPSNMGNIYQINRHPPCDDFANLQDCFENTVDDYAQGKVDMDGDNMHIETDIESARI